jgi:hypothetical protein
MKVITAYPVIVDKKRQSPNDYYLNSAGEIAAAQTKQGLLEKVTDTLGLTPAAQTAKPAEQATPKSKTMKYVLIGVGALAVVGIAYALLKK